MKPLLQEKYHQSIYIFALIILVVGLPLSKFLMSLSQIILIGNWLLEGNVKGKVTTFWRNKTAVVISSLLLLHFLGLLYTSDFDYAFKDIRIKFPLFVLPLILSSSKPLSQKLFDTILQFFVAAVIVGTVISTLIYTGVIYRPVVDIRGVSIFISHIRFALLICVAVFVSGYFIYNTSNKLVKIRGVLIIIWLVYFLTILESLTGIMVLCLTTLSLVLIYAIRSNIYLYKFTALLFIACSIVLLFIYIPSKINNNVDDVDFTKLEKYTSKGNLYEHDHITKAYENGHLIWIYYCKNELQESWNKRSKIKIGNKDLKGNDIYNTLIRFLASKDMRKDADAVLQLSDEEVKAIEKGTVNVNYLGMGGLKGRIYETVWEVNLYNNTGDANGHSLTQRFEYWKTALNIIKSNLIFGVGTGDIANAFDKEYEKQNSKLAKEWRLRSHNQYLSITVAFGIVGLLWFLITLIYPVLINKNGSNYLYLSFFIIAIISFFTEDTLETQAGVTFFAFLNNFLLFGKEEEHVD